MDDETLRKRKKTANAVIGVLRMSLQMAWENGKTDNDRSWRAIRRLRNYDKSRILFLTRGECRNLLDHCGPDLRLLVLGALYTGCRARELFRMQALHVGRDGYGVYVPPGKNYQPRFVFLPDEAMAFFFNLAKNKGSHELLFTARNGTGWLNLYRYPFKTAVRASGLPDEFCFHGLRHTYASQLVQAGTPLIVVSVSNRVQLRPPFRVQ
jgi:integrase